MERLAATLLFLACAGGSTAAGRALTAGRLPGADETDRTLVGASLGLGLLSLGTGLLAAAGRFGAPEAYALVALCWLAGARQARPLAAWLAGARARWETSPVAFALVALLLAASFVACWVPPHQYDSLLYHLELAQEYRRSGGLAAPPESLYSYFPQNGELLFTLALGLNSDLLAQMFMWWASALSALWIFRAAERERSTAAAWLAAGLLCAHTSFLLLASTTYVEPLVMLWTTAAAAAFFRWTEADAAPWLAASAAFAGLAMGTKYYAVIAAAILGAGAVWRTTRRGRLGDVLFFGAVAAALVAPWLARTAVLTGDPVYPFLFRAFARSRAGLLGEMAASYSRVMAPFAAGTRWRDLISPGAGGVDVLGGLGWQPTLGLALLGAWFARGDARLRRVALFCAAYAAGWFLTGTVVRFLEPLLPLLCLLGAAGVTRALDALAGGALRRTLAATVGVAALFQAGTFAYVHALLATPPVLAGTQSRDEFLAGHVDYYPCARFASSALPARAKVLLVGEQRGYYLERGHACANPYARDFRAAWADEARSPEALAGRLRTEGFTHVLVAPREGARLGTWAALSERGRRNWVALASGPATLAFQGPACALFALAPRVEEGGER